MVAGGFIRIAGRKPCTFPATRLWGCVIRIPFSSKSPGASLSLQYLDNIWAFMESKWEDSVRPTFSSGGVDRALGPPATEQKRRDVRAGDSICAGFVVQKNSPDGGDAVCTLT